ncbi:hypothetical protein GDO81_027201 [Engystomops pustulosus]|uniref:Uncharacterized protein n=1 Tax=Engystomops pustulosus TaxID=76066 RepID=A0AAV6YES2_ENGPU|nr:hypothetical protein GDO81_027201 [Engystomops pustulosus]
MNFQDFGFLEETRNSSHKIFSNGKMSKFTSLSELYLNDLQLVYRCSRIYENGILMVKNSKGGGEKWLKHIHFCLVERLYKWQHIAEIIGWERWRCLMNLRRKYGVCISISET